MDTVYLVLLWGPVVTIFLAGIMLLPKKSLTNNLVAVTSPAMLASVEAVVITTSLSNGSINALKGELIALLQLQVFFLFIVALILLFILLTRMITTWSNTGIFEK